MQKKEKSFCEKFEKHIFRSLLCFKFRKLQADILGMVLGLAAFFFALHGKIIFIL